MSSQCVFKDVHWLNTVYPRPRYTVCCHQWQVLKFSCLCSKWSRLENIWLSLQLTIWATDAWKTPMHSLAPEPHSLTLTLQRITLEITSNFNVHKLDVALLQSISKCLQQSTVYVFLSFYVAIWLLCFRTSRLVSFHLRVTGSAKQAHKGPTGMSPYKQRRNRQFNFKR